MWIRAACGVLINTAHIVAVLVDEYEDKFDVDAITAGDGMHYTIASFKTRAAADSLMQNLYTKIMGTGSVLMALPPIPGAK